MSNRRHNQRGIALITTLIMLSVVTVMAVAFLAVSRRERAAVTTSSDRLDARAMAEIALQRAEAEVVSRVLATSNLLSYDLLVSTNYFNRAGFVPGNTNIANVAFVYPDGSPVTGDDLLEVYRNLQIDPRVPVFVQTNLLSQNLDNRYYLDFNRNGRIETNGIQVEIDNAGQSLGFTNFHIGDPEWIGVLRRSDLPHSGSNHFVGRYAYLLLPAGKSLDLNFIHNQAKRNLPADDGFLRNQGVGSWEINLAAFLRELNTNAWNGYEYLTNLNIPSRGIAFEHANLLLNLRYRGSYNNLRSIQGLFGIPGANAFRTDFADGYSDGPLQLGPELPYTQVSPTVRPAIDDDLPAQPWSGADALAQYFDMQELFNVPGFGLLSFTNRLIQAGNTNSTYDRHTFYRLLGQLGTDSVPANRQQIHLNYDNRLDFDPRLQGRLENANWGYHATNFVRWTPLGFFTNAADQILKIQHPAPGNGVPDLGITNIVLWPTNYYSPEVHRSMQVAANIFDATTNTPSVTYPYFPTVFRPSFAAGPGGVIRITGYRDATFGMPVGSVIIPWGEPERWLMSRSEVPRFDLDERPRGSSAAIAPDSIVAGMPFVLGARKGFPNFNEIEVQTTVVATRKLELVKRSPTSNPAFTNQLYVVGISNVLGVEFWNSYAAAYPRPLRLVARLSTDIVLSNEVRVIRAFSGVFTNIQNIAAGQWAGGGPLAFRLPIRTNLLFLPMSAYRVSNGQLISIRTNSLASLFEPANGFPIPVWKLYMTNRLEAALVDMSVGGGRLVDYVNLDNLGTQIDVTRELFGQQNDTGQSSTVGSFWRTNRVQGVPEGVLNQIQASLGSINVSTWNSATAEPIQGQDKEKSVQRFREFMGMAGIGVPPSPTLRMQVPFSPGIKLFHNKSWQVNDPLVNDMVWDLEDPGRSNIIERLPPLFPVTDERSNMGKINHRYRPWQRNLYSSGDPTDFDPAFKDPQITSSDAWQFPTNALPTVGWLGRIHRGTPWQTIYLKSATVTPQQWQLWSGHPLVFWTPNLLAPGTQPTNDWKFLEVFTTTIGENASRGLLSVNQSGLAAWSALFSGVPVITNQFATNLGPVLITPNTPEVRFIVDGINAARALRPGQKFNYLGEILATPQLSLASPFLARSRGPSGLPADEVVERIPQMTLSLLKRDEPRFVIYAYGQSLRPAPGSVIPEPGPFFQMPTNYVITGEFVTKTRMRLEGFLENGRLRIRPIKEAYNEVPSAE